MAFARLLVPRRLAAADRSGTSLHFTPEASGGRGRGAFIIIFASFFLLFFFLLTWKEQTTGAFSISDVSRTARGRVAARTPLHGRLGPTRVCV